VQSDIADSLEKYKQQKEQAKEAQQFKDEFEELKKTFEKIGEMLATIVKIT